jgi:hypothetical protein
MDTPTWRALGAGETMYRVNFTISGTAYELLAEKIDFAHPYFVAVEELSFPDQSSLVISPNGNEARKRFGEARRLLLPVQSVICIEEIAGKDKIRHLSVAAATASDALPAPAPPASSDREGKHP